MNEILEHLEPGVLQALADGELAPREAGRVEAHLTECGHCRGEMDSLRQASLALSGALRELDRPASAVPAFRMPSVRVPVSSGAWDALPRAAILVLGLAGAASAAMPGSPLRGWVESLIGQGGGESPATVMETPVRAEPVQAPEAGVSIAPESGAVRLVLGDVAAGVVVTAMLTDGDRAGVYATGSAAGARFTTGRGRIDVVGAPGGMLRVEIPRGAAAATVTINGRDYVVKDGDRLRVQMPGATTTGTEVTFEVR